MQSAIIIQGCGPGRYQKTSPPHVFLLRSTRTLSHNTGHLVIRYLFSALTYWYPLWKSFSAARPWTNNSDPSNDEGNEYRVTAMKGVLTNSNDCQLLCESALLITKSLLVVFLPFFVGYLNKQFLAFYYVVGISYDFQCVNFQQSKHQTSSENLLQ